MSKSVFFDTTSFIKESLQRANTIVDILNNYSIINFGNLEESELLDIFSQTSSILLNTPLREDNIDIEELLDIENAYNHYCDFSGQLLRLLEKIAVCHQRRIDSESISWDLSECLADGADIIAELNQILTDYPKTDIEFLNKVYDLISAITATVKEVHEKQYPSVSIEMIQNAFRKYVSKDDGSTENELDVVRKHVRRREGRTLPINEQWDTMLSDVIDAEALALEGNLVDDTKFDYLFSEGDKKSMEKHHMIVSVVQCTSADDKLFGFRKAETNHNLLSKLTSDNLQTFFNLVHIENVLKCKIHPELKAKYDKFLMLRDLQDYADTPLNPCGIISLNDEQKIKKAKECIIMAVKNALVGKERRLFICLFKVMQDHGLTTKNLSNHRDFAQALVEWRLYPVNDGETQEDAINKFDSSLSNMVSTLRSTFSVSGRGELPKYRTWEEKSSSEYNLCMEIGNYFEADFPYPRTNN